MKRVLLSVLVLVTVLGAEGGGTRVVAPFEIDAGFAPANQIDSLVLASLRQHGIHPANLCSDAVFIRRAYLDVIGTLPDPTAVRTFLQDRRPTKRAELIDALLQREEFADYWSLKWCDLLRVKSEFPINLWPNAVQAYQRWIHDAIRENRPYDQFVRELLTSSGSNFRVPPVNFYRAVQQRDPGAIADAVALTFMGVRTGNWPEARRRGLAAFFSRIAYKETAEWKEEIVYLNPAAAGPLEATLPDGVTVTIPPGEDPRRVFADWLVAKNNPWFARSVVNRIWAWLLGRGIIQEPDDIRPDNPPANPELLAYLEQSLVGANYDLKHVYRLILNSRTYQQSSIPAGDQPETEALFACYRARRLDAEVLADALDWIAGEGEDYSSTTPEPYSFLPQQERSIALADGSITSDFLAMFGRPARDTGLESERTNTPTTGQRLHLLNSSHVQQKIARSQRLRTLTRATNGDQERLIRGIYVTILSRDPTASELAAAQEYAKTPGLNQEQAAQDLAWALINTKEFLYRH